MNSQSPHALMTDLLIILRHTVASFVYNRFSEAHPGNFSTMMEQHLKDNQNAKIVKQGNADVFEQRERFAELIDIHGVLQLIDRGWSDAFKDYPDSMQEDARILSEKRHVWAHQKHISLQDVQDVAESAKRLLKTMKTPSAKKAVKRIEQLLAVRHDYYRNIYLPAYYIPRTDLLDQLKAELSFSGSTVIALHGMGGIGKSVLARSLCDDKAVQELCADGILWMTFGSEVNAPELTQKLGDWIKALNGKVNDSDNSSLESLKNRLAELLKDRACLLVLDDVWRKSDFETFRVGGVKCRTIMTTRDAEIARDVGAKLLPVPTMNAMLAIELLEKWSQGKLATTSHKLKQTIANRLGGLPLAVKLAGAQLQTKPPQIWLENFDVRKLKSNRPEDIHDSLELTFGLSLDTLNTLERKLYSALSIFKKDMHIHEGIIVHFWEALGQLSPDSTQDLVTDLASRALCEVAGDAFPRSIVLHDLLRDFIKHELHDTQATHQALVSAYQNTQMGAGWHTVPDDGYFYTSFAYHLQQAGALDILRQSLFDYSFLQAKLNATDMITLIMDYDYLSDDPTVKLAQSVLVMSKDVLDSMPEQLPVQLYAGLLNFKDKHPEIDALREACFNTLTPHLFPTTETTRRAGGVLVYVVDDKTVKTWQWQTGDELSIHERDTVKQNGDILAQFIASPAFHTRLKEDFPQLKEEANTPTGTGESLNLAGLKGATFFGGWSLGRALEHLDAINSVALWGEFAVTASDDTTLKVWNWQTGKELRTFRGHTAAVLSVTLSGEFAESVSSDNTVKTWNWQTGEEIRTRKGHTDDVLNVAVLGDFSVSPSENTLEVSNRQTGEHVTTFYADSPQSAVAIAPDASIIVSGGQDGRVNFLRPNPTLIKILWGGI